jgi:hypothetical protein
MIVDVVILGESAKVLKVDAPVVWKNLANQSIVLISKKAQDIKLKSTEQRTYFKALLASLTGTVVTCTLTSRSPGLVSSFVFRKTRSPLVASEGRSAQCRSPLLSVIAFRLRKLSLEFQPRECQVLDVSAGLENTHVVAGKEGKYKYKYIYCGRK